MTIYVLTEEYNQYDQYGEYFVHAWTVKPTRDQLQLHVHYYADLDYILCGGGRRGKEDQWYNLVEVNE
jgi:hypothetical protein